MPNMKKANKEDVKRLNIVIPMAGRGSRFQQSGYTFPKPLVDIKGKPMIEVVINNLKPKHDHRFIFIAQKEHCQKYDVYNVLKRATDNNFELVQIDGVTEGAACTVLTAARYIDSDEALMIANSDQYIDTDIDAFIRVGGSKGKDGLIMTFPNSHPKWSYARTGAHGKVLEVAEKKVISPQATVGIYFFRNGSDFVRGAKSMIYKDIRHNNEFYVCPVYNELILDKKNIYTNEITPDKMHGIGTPEDLTAFVQKIERGIINLP